MKLGARKRLFLSAAVSVAILACQAVSTFFTAGSPKTASETEAPQESEQAAGEEAGGTSASPGFSLKGQLGGSAMAVAVAGDHAVLGQGPRVVMLDLSDPTRPVLAGQSDVLPGLVMGIAVAGDYAYAAAMYGGLHILDISSPTDLRLVASAVPKVPGCNDVTIEDDIAYMACNPGGLFIVDVGVPSEPDILFQDSSVTGAMLSIARAGDYVYLADATAGALQIWDVKDPRSPVVGEPFSFEDLPGAVAGQSGIPSVRPCGERLCLSAGPHGLYILGLDDPSRPAPLGRFDTPLTSGLVANGDTVFLADDQDGIYAIDVSSAGKPIEVGRMATAVGGWELTVQELGPRGLWAQDGLLLIPDAAYGLTVVDVGNPQQPSRLGSYMTPVPNVLFGLELQDDNAFVISRFSGFRTVDVSDPGRLRELAYDDERKDLYLQNPSALVVSGSHAYVADSNYPLHIYDISDPANPVQTGAVYDHAAPDGASDVVLYGDIAYLAGSGAQDAFYPGEGIWVIDVADANDPQPIQFVDVSNREWRLAVANGYLFALDGLIDEKDPAPFSLHVFDLTNPRQPREVDTIPIPELQPLGRSMMLADEDRLYISVPMMGVLVFDVSEPARPQRTATIPILATMDGMGKTGQYLLMGGIMAYDVSDPQKPDVAGIYGTLPAWDFAVNEDMVYVATSFQGLYVLRFDAVSLGTYQSPFPTP